MADDYPPFDPNSRCPKCAYDAINTEYEYEIRALTEEQTERGFIPSRLPRPERLRRTCARCSHYWFEGVLDAQPG